MDKEVLTFENIEIEKIDFTINRFLFFLFWEIQILKKYQYLTRFHLAKKNYKYFIGDLYNGNKIKLLNMMFPKASAYVKSCDGETKCMYFLIDDDDLLKK